MFLELRTLALHDKQLFAQVRQHDRTQISILGEILQPICGKTSPTIAAEVAYSLAQGLYMGETLSRFDTTMARAYFEATMRNAINRLPANPTTQT